MKLDLRGRGKCPGRVMLFLDEQFIYLCMAHLFLLPAQANETRHERERLVDLGSCWHSALDEPHEGK